MSERDITDQSAPLPGQFSRHSNIKTGRHAETSPSSNHKLVGVEPVGKAPRRIKFMFRDGRVMSMPYAYLPTIVFTPEQDLRLRTGEYTIIIHGRCLDKLETWLSEESVSWIQESPSTIDDGQCDVFIAQITVQGELEM